MQCLQWQRELNHQDAFHIKRRHFIGTERPESRHPRTGWQHCNRSSTKLRCRKFVANLASPCLRSWKSKQVAPRIWSNSLLTLIVLAVHRWSSRHLQFKKVGSHALVAMIFYMLLSPRFRTSAWSELTQGRNHFVLEFSSTKPVSFALKGVESSKKIWHSHYSCFCSARFKSSTYWCSEADQW